MTYRGRHKPLDNTCQKNVMWIRVLIDKLQQIYWQYFCDFENKEVKVLNRKKYIQGKTWLDMNYSDCAQSRKMVEIWFADFFRRYITMDETFNHHYTSRTSSLVSWVDSSQWAVIAEKWLNLKKKKVIFGQYNTLFDDTDVLNEEENVETELCFAAKETNRNVGELLK